MKSSEMKRLTSTSTRWRRPPTAPSMQLPMSLCPLTTRTWPMRPTRSAPSLTSSPFVALPRAWSWRRTRWRRCGAPLRGAPTPPPSTTRRKARPTGPKMCGGGRLCRGWKRARPPAPTLPTTRCFGRTRTKGFGCRWAAPARTGCSCLGAPPLIPPSGTCWTWSPTRQRWRGAYPLPRRRSSRRVAPPSTLLSTSTATRSLSRPTLSMFFASSWSALWVEPNGMKRTHPTAIGSGSKLHLLRTGLVGCHLFRMRAEDRSETGLHWESTQGHLACSVGVMRWLAHIHFRRKNWGRGSSKCVFFQPHCRPGQPPIESRNCWTNPIRWLPGPWNPKEPLEAVLTRRGPLQAQASGPKISGNLIVGCNGSAWPLQDTLIGLQDYWRQLSANSTIVACRTANPTSFLCCVVGSACLLSATAIFWRLATGESTRVYSTETDHQMMLTWASNDAQSKSAISDHLSGKSGPSSPTNSRYRWPRRHCRAGRWPLMPNVKRRRTRSAGPPRTGRRAARRRRHGPADSAAVGGRRQQRAGAVPSRPPVPAGGPTPILRRRGCPPHPLGAGHATATSDDGRGRHSGHNVRGPPRAPPPPPPRGRRQRPHPNRLRRGPAAYIFRARCHRRSV